MKEFKRIRRSQVKPTVVPGGRLSVVITLDGDPDPAWLQRYKSPRHISGPIELMEFTPMPSGRRISFDCSEGQFKDYVAHIDERIRQANDSYEAEVIPAREREEKAAADAKRQLDERQAQVDQMIRDLPPPPD